MNSELPLAIASRTASQKAEVYASKHASFGHDRHAARQDWSNLALWRRRDVIATTNVFQLVVSAFYLIITLIGTCHFGRRYVCFIEPWLSNFLPLGAFQLGINLTYFFWPDTPEKLGKTKSPLLVHLVSLIGWSINLLPAGILMYEGIKYGSSYHFIHIPRFILSVAELTTTLIILIATIRRFLRPDAPTLPR